METGRVRLVDIADELGLSTATVSNVIHGKTKKISDETVKRVQELLEKRQYIPSMAGILLAQNDSNIIGVVINDHEKYEGHTLEDRFISASVNALAKELEQENKFLMLKVTDKWNEIPKFASMWNMEGMVLIGFCEQDYKKLREQMHIPFVVYDGYMESSGNLVNIEVDHFDGGVQAGRYLKDKGHRKVLCISDNNICMDRERYRITMQWTSFSF
jgi:LacI family transcriptional regulator